MQNMGNVIVPNAAQAITFYMQRSLAPGNTRQGFPITNHLNQHTVSPTSPDYEITLVLGEDTTVAKTATGATLSGTGATNKLPTSITTLRRRTMPTTWPARASTTAR